MTRCTDEDKICSHYITRKICSHAHAYTAITSLPGGCQGLRCRRSIGCWNQMTQVDCTDHTKVNISRRVYTSERHENVETVPNQLATCFRTMQCLILFCSIVEHVPSLKSSKLILRATIDLNTLLMPLIFFHTVGQTQTTFWILCNRIVSEGPAWTTTLKSEQPVEMVTTVISH